MFKIFLIIQVSLYNIEKAGTSQPVKFSYKLFNTSIVKVALEKLNTTNASGYEAITPRISKHASGGIATSLTKLYNESIQRGEGE